MLKKSILILLMSGLINITNSYCAIPSVYSDRLLQRYITLHPYYGRNQKIEMKDIASIAREKYRI